MTHNGTWSQRHAAKSAEKRLGRVRVCHTCAEETEAISVLGHVHSELPCDRCKVTPCNGVIMEVENMFRVPDTKGLSYDF